MTHRQQWSVVGGVVALLAVALWVITRVYGSQLFPVGVGSSAPEFTATTLDVTPATKHLADYKGQVVLLNIWATWCGPCRVEMPSIEKLHTAMADKGLKIVAVSIDDPNTEKQIQSFAQQYGLTFEILHDPTHAIEKDYQTTGVPETFLIGRDGTIRQKVIGATDWSSPDTQKLVYSLLQEPAK